MIIQLIQLYKIVIYSDTNITLYLSVSVQIPKVASNTYSRMKQIHEHYFHNRADESTEILDEGRKIQPVEENLR